MTCPRCGAYMSSSLCPRCDGRQSPARLPLFSEHLVPVIHLRAPRDALASLAGRWWGSYHRFLAGKEWEGGEHEVCRAELSQVSVYAVDRHVALGASSLCLLTNRRLVVIDYRRRLLEVDITTVRAANVFRDYDRRTGSSFGVAIHRLGGTLEDPRGDICLVCRDARLAYQLVLSIAEAGEPRHVTPPV